MVVVFILGLSGIFLISYLLVTYLNLSSEKRCNAPGPDGYPLFGNWLQLDTVKPWYQLMEWEKQFGDVYKLKFGFKEILVVNGESIYDVLVKRSNDFMGRPDNGRFKRLLNYHDITTRNADEKWKDFRKVVHQAIRQYGKGVLRIQEMSQQQVQKCVEKLANTNGEPLDPFDDIFLSVANVAVIAFAGVTLEKDHPLIVKIKQLNIVANRMLGIDGIHLDVYPWLRYIPHKLETMVQDTKKIQDEALGMIWDLIHTDTDFNNPQGVFQEFLVNQRDRDNPPDTEQDKKPPLADAEIRGLIQNLLVGGLLTTANVMKSMIAYMIDRPNIQTKLQQEVDQVLAGRQSTLDDRRSMPYTEAFILEALRHTSVLPILVPHMTLTDTKLAGYNIPKGMQVWVHTFGLHHNEKFFPDPWTFNPDRFIEEDGSLMPTHKRKLLLPFGAGRRVCVGEQFARIRLFLFITTMMQHLTFLPEAPDKKPNYDPRDSIIGIILRMKDYKVRVMKRK